MANDVQKINLTIQSTVRNKHTSNSKTQYEINMLQHFEIQKLIKLSLPGMACKIYYFYFTGVSCYCDIHELF